MLGLGIALGVVAVLMLLWIYLIAPGKTPDISAYKRPYAHRGLWKEGVPENSLTAFRAAADAGFAMELDVQLSADGVVMVFHDYTLVRMTGADGKLSDCTAEELATLRLGDTDEKIPTFAEVLAAVDGRTPLLVELKGETANDALCEAVAALLDNYEGDYIVESFNPLLLAWFRKNRPQVVRGLLVTDMFAKKKQRTFAQWVRDAVVQGRLLNFRARPQFLAWNLHAEHTFVDRLILDVWKKPSFGWTARDKALYDSTQAAGTFPIFDSIGELY